MAGDTTDVFGVYDWEHRLAQLYRVDGEGCWQLVRQVRMENEYFDRGGVTLVDTDTGEDVGGEIPPGLMFLNTLTGEYRYVPRDYNLPADFSDGFDPETGCLKVRSGRTNRRIAVIPGQQTQETE